MHALRQLDYAVDDLAHVLLAHHWRKRLVDIDNVVRQAAHRVVAVECFPAINELAHFRHVTRDLFRFSHCIYPPGWLAIPRVRFIDTSLLRASHPDAKGRACQNLLL